MVPVDELVTLSTSGGSSRAGCLPRADPQESGLFVALDESADRLRTVHDAIHFVIGYSGPATVREVWPNARVVSSTDDPSEGPCRFDGDRDLATFLERRDVWRERELQVPGLATDEDAAEDRAALVSALAAARDRGAIVWCGDTLQDQLACAWIAASIAGEESVARVSVAVVSGAFSGAPASPDAIAAGEPRALNEAERRQVAGMWRRFVRPTPQAFFEEAIALRDDPLCGHLWRMANRFPDASDGLTLHERGLLRRLAEHPDEPTARTVAEVLIGARYEYDAVGSLTLFARLRELAHQGLLTQVGAGSTGQTSFSLTDLGRRVLDGRANRLDEAGVDRWIGGTHLRADGSMWVLDGQRVRPR